MNIKIPASLFREIRGAVPPESVSGVFRDSRQVTPGSAFIALPGVQSDGHAYIGQALRQGARLIVYSRFDIPLPDKPGVTFARVDDPGKVYWECRREEAGFPDEKLDLFGVTGTNGKTTTVYLWKHLLHCGMVSTVENFDGQNATPAAHTTPAPETLLELFENMVKHQLSAAAMEVSSHALDQHRCGPIRFRAAVFTNLTGDHLDYHKTMENYYQAKKRLFSEMLRPDGVGIFNCDDAGGRRLVKELKGKIRLLTFGSTSENDWQLQSGNPAKGEFLLTRRSDGKAEPFRTNLIGEHNFHNLTGAILAALDYGMTPEDIREKLKEDIRVPGRLEKIVLPTGAEAFVDYAHTDDALRNVLAILRKLTRGRLIVVFGAGGDRDRTKRPRMGLAVAELADAGIITSDNPRSENPEAIIDEIFSGVPASRKNVFTCEPERAKALWAACRLSRPGDVILAAGKGHETTQEIAGIRYPFDDAEVLRNFQN